MKKFDEMISMITDDFSVMSEEALMLVVGGMSPALNAAGSCGSSRSSSQCDATSVCNCCYAPTVVNKAKELFSQQL